MRRNAASSILFGFSAFILAYTVLQWLMVRLPWLQRWLSE
jgi:hypothetical protein